ncbi:cardiolipin synthase [Swingsia samuiensis]|uniref:Cardiolipin synthase n=1 Tax=Swingsia samuiensis TaxID=1293412 RepID=A0A4Y6UGK2_9PROT|nr:cardiolipin synthase [Swingsia samuiensis]QDH16702.1 cardiolipin synthase [Swingsia samuiensis]
MSRHFISISIIFFLQAIFIIRALIRKNREPAARIAWVAVIGALPIIGIIAYLFLGETNPGKEIVERIRFAMRHVPLPGRGEEQNAPIDVETAYNLPPRAAPLFRLGQSINDYAPLPGNRAELMPDSNTAIERIVEDIDQAQHTVHVCFYIWLEDNNGTKVAQALMRAAKRGVVCRVMADDLGSRGLIHGKLWEQMKSAGVHLVRTLPIGNILLRPLHGRFDMRNHRKTVVIDNKLTYCGSQNCADPEFRVKAKYAPWVDLFARFEGPVVLQMQHLFATDWMSHTTEDLAPLLEEAEIPSYENGFVAQVIGTSAAIRSEAMPEMFAALMGSAKDELILTTPYFVPDDALLSALLSCGHRGVKVTMIMPRVNDSWIVGGASRSYYLALLKAGVRIFEYPRGLLHTKSITIDEQMTLIGSANMDRRSFELNFENNIFLYDRDFTKKIKERQLTYLEESIEISLEEVKQWPMHVVLWNNVLSTLGPVL